VNNSNLGVTLKYLILAAAMSFSFAANASETKHMKLPEGNYTIYDTSGNGLGEYTIRLYSVGNLVAAHDGYICIGDYDLEADPNHAHQMILTLSSRERGCQVFRNAKVVLSEVPQIGAEGVHVSAESMFPAKEGVDNHKIHMSRTN
jgi:hypothetical protein